jgi:hypothetical protein
MLETVTEVDTLWMRTHGVSTAMLKRYTHKALRAMPMVAQIPAVVRRGWNKQELGRRLADGPLTSNAGVLLVDLVTMAAEDGRVREEMCQRYTTRQLRTLPTYRDIAAGHGKGKWNKQDLCRELRRGTVVRERPVPAQTAQAAAQAVQINVLQEEVQTLRVSQARLRTHLTAYVSSSQHAWIRERQQHMDTTLFHPGAGQRMVKGCELLVQDGVEIIGSGSYSRIIRHQHCVYKLDIVRYDDAVHHQEEVVTTAAVGIPTGPRGRGTNTLTESRERCATMQLRDSVILPGHSGFFVLGNDHTQHCTLPTVLPTWRTNTHHMYTHLRDFEQSYPRESSRNKPATRRIHSIVEFYWGKQHTAERWEEAHGSTTLLDTSWKMFQYWLHTVRVDHHSIDAWLREKHMRTRGVYQTTHQKIHELLAYTDTTSAWHRWMYTCIVEHVYSSWEAWRRLRGTNLRLEVPRPLTFTLLPIEPCTETLYEMLRRLGGKLPQQPEAADDSLQLAFLRVVLFKVYWSLAAAQENLPGFRHNDLHANNIMFLPHATSEPDVFQVGTAAYSMPVPAVLYVGSVTTSWLQLQPVIIDFGLTRFQGIHTNHDLITQTDLRRYGIHTQASTTDADDDRVSDLLLFARSVLLYADNLAPPVRKSLEEHFDRVVGHALMTASYAHTSRYPERLDVKTYLAQERDPTQRERVQRDYTALIHKATHKCTAIFADELFHLFRCHTAFPARSRIWSI